MVLKILFINPTLFAARKIHGIPYIATWHHGAPPELDQHLAHDHENVAGGSEGPEVHRLGGGSAEECFEFDNECMNMNTEYKYKYK